MCRTRMLRGLIRLSVCLSLPCLFVAVTACDAFDDESDGDEQADAAFDGRSDADVPQAEPDMAGPDLSPPPQGCANGRRDGSETGVDCGGDTCAPCGTGGGCAGDFDCAEGRCEAGECAAPRCGDGLVQSGEPCDDGNTDDTDTCTSACELARCGDGLVGPGEGCDDGNTIDTDGCTNACALPTCGDGIVQPGERCDDGNLLNTDTCLNTCAPARCGDGFILMGVETCDDANANDTDACPASCVVAHCGDGFVRAGVEQCDDGNPDDGDACTNACREAVCGDGIVAETEACDDGNATDTDACTTACKPATCGDGLVQFGVEQCDDGNLDDDDACPSTCRHAGCGDGFVGPGEQCDDANTDNGDDCLTSCELPRCGDGIVSADEQCDDGNLDDGDACSSTCELATCQDGVRNGSETDLDCGGPDCAPCRDGRACDDPSDCEAAFCSYGRVCRPAVSCLDHRLAGESLSGVYLVAPDGGARYPVYCDMVTDGGGWTLVASSRTTPLSDEASGYHDGLATHAPAAGHRGIWSGLRGIAGATSDLRFTCKHLVNAPDMVVDLSFYGTPWYDEITTGSDAQSCFNEGDGRGWDGPYERRNNLTGQRLGRSVPRDDRQGCSGVYMEGEDVCGDPQDFTVDFNGRGKDCNESDGTDWGEDDGELKCGQGALGGGTWHLWVREHTCGDGARNRDESDVDCGGASCGACGDGLRCESESDCASGLCQAGVCRAASCGNGLLDSGELDVDCGGASCGACGAGLHCNAGSDCQSGICEGGVCVAVPASCLDALAQDPGAGDGVYVIDPDGSGFGLAFPAYCDMTTAGGGWTLALNAGIGDFERGALGDPSRSCYDERCLGRAFSTVAIGSDVMLDASDGEILGDGWDARSIVTGVDPGTRGLTLRQIFADEATRYYLEAEDNANLATTFRNGLGCGATNWSDYGNQALCGPRVLVFNDPLSCSGNVAALGAEQSLLTRWNNCGGWPQSPDHGGTNGWPDFLRIWVR